MSLQAIEARGELYRKLRLFFAERNVKEVNTPLLQATSVTDPYLEPIKTDSGYLQTSPEYAMKRLLVAGSGDIYQICKAFRKEETSKKHRSEFTLLEWYRLGFDQWDLMADVADVVELALGTSHFEHISYRQLFLQYLGFDPFTISNKELIAHAKDTINIEMFEASRDDWLNLLLSHLIEPILGQDAPVFIYDYPPSQASLAKVNQDEQGEYVAERFELYYKGLELCNGYHELTDAKEQRQRFHEDNRQRLKMGKKPLPIDYSLLEALEQGLPQCAGVALGLDRLLMLQLKTTDIQDVLWFTIKKLEIFQKIVKVLLAIYLFYI